MNVSTRAFAPVVVGLAGLVAVAAVGHAQAELIAHWTFNEARGTTAFDQAGHASGPHDGTLLPAPPDGPTWVVGPGGVGTALAYDGVDDRIDVPPFDVEGPGITIAAWIKPNTIGSDDRIVSKATDDFNSSHFWALVFKSDTRLEFRLRTDVGRTLKGTAGSSPTVPIGEWSHVAGTWSSTDETKRVYINGVEVQAFSQPGTRVYTEADRIAEGGPMPPGGVRVGVGNQSLDAGFEGFPESLDRPVNGGLDDVRIYNEALSTAQLQQLVAEGPTVCPLVDRVSHALTFPIVLTAADLPAQVTVPVAIPTRTTGTVTLTSSEPSVAGGAMIAFSATGSTCGSAVINVGSVGSTTLTLANDFGLSNGAAREMIVLDAVDLGDVVSAGDGTGNKLPISSQFGPFVGLDQDFGIFQNSRLENFVPAIPVEVGDENNINPIAIDGRNDTDDSPWIDSAFVINAESMTVNSAGVSFNFDAGDANAAGGWDFILDGLEPGGPDRLQIGDYTSTRGVGIHAAAGITYDLDALRSTHGSGAVGFFSAGAGEGSGGRGGTATNHVILSGNTDIISSVKLGPHSDSGEMVEIEIPPAATYLTLAVGAGGDGVDAGDDRGVFLDAVITPGSLLDILATHAVSADRDTLSAGESAQVQVVRRFAGRGSLGAGVVIADSYSSDNPAVATVDANGRIDAVGGGAATISAAVGGNVVGTVSIVVESVATPPSLIQIADGLGGINVETGLADMFLSPLGEECAFSSFGLEATEPLTLNGVTSTYTGGGAVPATSFADNGGGQHTVMLDPALEPGEWLKLELDVAGAGGGSTVLTVWVGHQPLDINQDGRTNIQDATAFGDVFRGTQEGRLIDINCDGRVNVQDATAFGANWIQWANTAAPPLP